MHIFRNISLKKYNTFGLDYKADCLIRIRTEKEAIALFKNEIRWKKPLLILGRGSNILFTDDFKGTILVPDFGTMRIENLENEHIVVSAGAGIEWDRFVEWSATMGFSGLENLSGIPGNVGAVPVQNLGAYGTEARDTVVKVRTICIADGKIKVFTNDECRFGYRTSIFKSEARGKYLVTRVYFRLAMNHEPNLDYGILKEEVNKLGRPTLRNIRKAVIIIRQSKLPDPEIIGNAGSFFKNPVVSKQLAEKLKKEYPGIPVYDDISGNKKLAAGWLIEQCGWKGKRIGDAGVHDKQALVLVNYGNATGKEIYDLSEEIRASVLKEFGVDLEREVEVIYSF
jgi:UDP-N-acetylmuramate dehydrogenase